MTDLAFETSFDPGRNIIPAISATRWASEDQAGTRAHGLDANFEATPDQFKVNQAMLSTGPSRITINATLDDYAHPRLQGEYQAAIDAGSLRQTIRNQSLPVGVIHIAGSMQYQEQPNVSLMQSMHLAGNMTSPSLLLQNPSMRLNATNISVRYRLDEGDLTVNNMRANVLGGGLTGEFTMSDVTGDQNAHLRAALRNVGLAGVQSLLQNAVPSSVTLKGTTNAEVDATWKKSLADLSATANAGLNGTVRPSSATLADAFPLNGEIHATYNGPAKKYHSRELRSDAQDDGQSQRTVSRQANLGFSSSRMICARLKRSSPRFINAATRAFRNRFILSSVRGRQATPRSTASFRQ